jgi:hypothetical protein
MVSILSIIFEIMDGATIHASFYQSGFVGLLIWTLTVQYKTQNESIGFYRFLIIEKLEELSINGKPYTDDRRRHAKHCNAISFSERLNMLNFFDPQFSHMGQLLVFTLIIWYLPP